MNIAILFDANHVKYNGIYGSAIRNTIFSGNVLQESNRHMKVSVGDILVPSYVAKDQIEKNLYFWHPWQKLHEIKLRATYNSKTVYAWLVQNVTREISEKLHSFLSEEDSYLGLHQVEFSHPVHLAVYRNSLIPTYRLCGNTCNIFYSMGNEEGKDSYEAVEIKKTGFEKVIWEDNGARQTIFDDFDTVEHFAKVNEFQKTIAPFMTENENSADELVMLIEDLNPKLFNSLGAAVKVLSNANNEEDYAQVALSTRRYFEQLADVLFPSRNTLYNGRKVTNADYKNRIWAHISDSVITTDPEREEKIMSLGGEVDRLVVEYNAVLHSEQEKERLMKCFIDIAKLSIKLLTISTDTTKNPYYGFNNNIIKFAEEFINQKNNKP